jgi:hypothetical protein
VFARTLVQTRPSEHYPGYFCGFPQSLSREKQLQHMKLAAVTPFHNFTLHCSLFILTIDATKPGYFKASFLAANRINLLKSSVFFNVPPGLTFKIYTSCSLSVECFVRISGQRLLLYTLLNDFFLVIIVTVQHSTFAQLLVLLYLFMATCFGLLPSSSQYKHKSY